MRTPYRRLTRWQRRIQNFRARLPHVQSEQDAAAMLVFLLALCAWWWGI